MSIQANFHHVQESVLQACVKAGRDPASVTLVAVSKTHPADAVLEAAAAGAQHFGENRVEEAESKIPAVNAQNAQPLTWHMIGHIQSRKAKEIVPLFQQVHSVDSLKLAAKLSGLAVGQGKRLTVFLEMNVSGEESKYGIQAVRWQEDVAVRERVWTEIGQIAALPGLEVHGLMTMAPIVPVMEQARPVFASLAALRTAVSDTLKIELPGLSMGMTDDYPVAIEEGATLVRIGRAIFGERDK